MLATGYSALKVFAFVNMLECFALNSSYVPAFQLCHIGQPPGQWVVRPPSHRIISRSLWPRTRISIEFSCLLFPDLSSVSIRPLWRTLKHISAISTISEMLVFWRNPSRLVTMSVLVRPRISNAVKPIEPYSARHSCELSFIVVSQRYLEPSRNDNK